MLLSLVAWNSYLKIFLNFQVHHKTVLLMAENIVQNKSFVKYEDTPASKVSPFDSNSLLPTQC